MRIGYLDATTAGHPRVIVLADLDPENNGMTHSVGRLENLLGLNYKKANSPVRPRVGQFPVGQLRRHHLPLGRGNLSQHDLCRPQIDDHPEQVLN